MKDSDIRMPVIYALSVSASRQVGKGTKGELITPITGPSPSEIALNNCTAHERSENSSNNKCESIDNNGGTSLLRSPDVGQRTANVGDGRRPEEAREEPGDHDSLNILGNRRGE